jgi:hypothetical protein
MFNKKLYLKMYFSLILLQYRLDLISYEEGDKQAKEIVNKIENIEQERKQKCYIKESQT